MTVIPRTGPATRTALAFALVGCVACSEDPAEPTQAPTSNAAGCYTLGLGTWMGPPRDSWDPALHFQLSRTARAEGPGAGAMSVLPTSIGGDLLYPYASWRQPHRDSLVVDFSSGFVGVRLEMGRRGRIGGGQGWTGVAQAWTDTPTPMPSASAVLQPAACAD